MPREYSMRAFGALCISAALLFAVPAKADENLFPPSYTPMPQLDSYGNLRNAKFEWLRDKRDIAENNLRHYLDGSGPVDAEERKENIKRLRGEVRRLGAEIDLLWIDPPTQAQRDLVKKNVQAWIRALRAEAARQRGIAEAEGAAASAATTAQDAQRHRDAQKDATKAAGGADIERSAIEEDLEKSHL